MSDIEPMTAAAWERLYSYVGSPAWYIGTLAALEERERLLGERAVLVDERDRAKHEAAEVRRLCESDAALGALVRRIREHPMARGCARVRVDAKGATSSAGLTEGALESLLSALDSLLPKEPEVVTGASGNRYSMVGGQLWIDWVRDGFRTMGAKSIPLADAPVVAALMESAKESGK